jgi:hypothetical protein
MNRYANTILLGFTSAYNRKQLHTTLDEYFHNSTVSRFLSDNIDQFITNYAKTVELELKLSDPIDGLTVYDQVSYYNNEFIENTAKFIHDHIGEGVQLLQYRVGDGNKLSRYSYSHKNANTILDSWRKSPARQMEYREDPQGDNCDNNNSSYDNTVLFCDQSALGTSNHIDSLLSGKYIMALNSTTQSHETTPFGVSTRNSDARLLSRRTFRNNERGVENAIPCYEARLYRRNIDRDISESLRTREHGCRIAASYNMKPVYQRMRREKK